jgi:hypothetical protein
MLPIGLGHHQGFVRAARDRGQRIGLMAGKIAERDPSVPIPRAHHLFVGLAGSHFYAEHIAFVEQLGASELLDKLYGLMVRNEQNGMNGDPSLIEPQIVSDFAGGEGWQSAAGSG